MFLPLNNPCSALHSSTVVPELQILGVKLSKIYIFNYQSNLDLNVKIELYSWKRASEYAQISKLSSRSTRIIF